MITYPTSNKRILEKIIEKGIPHIKECGNISTVVKIEGQKSICFTDKPMDFATLGFMSKVRADVRLELKKMNIFKPIKTGKTKYYKHSRVESCENIIEIDVNGAYWKIAYNKGYISKKLYDFGLKVPKQRRLIGLGALASSKVVWEFNQETKGYERIGEKVDPVLRSVFMDVSFELDSMMLNLFHEVPYIFYWVDAIFCKQEYSDQVESYFKDLDLDVKFKNYTKLVRYKKSFKVINEDNPDDNKTFYIPSKKSAKRIKDLAYINYTEHARK